MTEEATAGGRAVQVVRDTVGMFFGIMAFITAFSIIWGSYLMFLHEPLQALPDHFAIFIVAMTVLVTFVVLGVVGGVIAALLVGGVVSGRMFEDGGEQA